MTKDKLSIRLKIAGKSYPLGVDPAKEEIYRRAESEINDYVVRMTQQQYKGFEERDYLAMAALRFAIEYVDMSRSRKVQDEDMLALERIDARLESYLDESALK